MFDSLCIKSVNNHIIYLFLTLTFFLSYYTYMARTIPSLSINYDKQINKQNISNKRGKVKFLLRIM